MFMRMRQLETLTGNAGLRVNSAKSVIELHANSALLLSLSIISTPSEVAQIA
jgi:hypothetical protein